MLSVLALGIANFCYFYEEFELTLVFYVEGKWSKYVSFGFWVLQVFIVLLEEIKLGWDRVKLELRVELEFQS